MKKSWILAAAVVLLVVAVAGAIVMGGRSSGDDKPKTTPAGDSGQRDDKAACEYLTQSVADKVIGQPGSEKGALAPESSSDDIKVSVCTYTQNLGEDASLESIRNVRSVTLLVRAPLNEVGAESNKAPFKTPGGATTAVTGYGQQAFWDAEAGQLNILSDDVWYILSVGKSRAADRTLDEAKAFADSIALNNNIR